MTRLLGSSVLLLVAISTATAQAVHPRNPLGTGPEVVSAGHALYNRTCTACHGIDGGEGERAPALVGDRRFFRLSENSIFDTIRGGIPGTAMPPFSLPDDDLWRIVVFIRAMRGSASETDVPGNAQQGMAVFCEPFRRAAIQCFDQTDIAAARKWLSDSQAQNGGISKMNIKQIEVTTMQMVADDKGLLAIERKHRNLRQAIR